MKKGSIVLYTTTFIIIKYNASPATLAKEDALGSRGKTLAGSRTGAKSPWFAGQKGAGGDDGMLGGGKGENRAPYTSALRIHLGAVFQNRP